MWPPVAYGVIVSDTLRDFVTLTFDPLTLAGDRTWRVTCTTPPPSLRILRLSVLELWIVTSPIGYHWQSVCACAVSRNLSVGDKFFPHIWNPWSRLAYSLYNLYGSIRQLNEVRDGQTTTDAERRRTSCQWHAQVRPWTVTDTCRLALARYGRSGPVQAWRYSPPMSPQRSAAVSGRLLRSSLRHRQSSATTFRTSLLADRIHVIDVAHSAVGHCQSPDPLSGTCFHTNSETPTVLSLHSYSHWRHSSSTSICVLQRIGGVTIMRYINLHFIYILTYSTIKTNWVIRQNSVWPCVKDHVVLSAHEQNYVNVQLYRKSFSTVVLGDHDFPLAALNFGNLTAFMAMLSRIFTAHAQKWVYMNFLLNFWHCSSIPWTTISLQICFIYGRPME